MSEKKESASIRFQSPASLPVYHRFQALLLRRKAENPERKVYAWQVMAEALDALERLDQYTVIEYSPDMELSEFVKACTQAALDDISESEKIDLEKIRSGKLTQEDVKRLKPLTAQNETK